MPFTVETARAAYDKAQSRLEFLEVAAEGLSSIDGLDEKIDDLDEEIRDLKAQRSKLDTKRQKAQEILDRMDEDEIAEEYDALSDECRRLLNWIKDEEKKLAKAEAA